MGASPGLADEEERAARRAADDALADRIETLEIDAFAREWGSQPLFADQPARVAAGAHADRLRNTPQGLAAALSGLGTGVMEPLWDRLPELPIPVTLVVGERDEKFRAPRRSGCSRGYRTLGSSSSRAPATLHKLEAAGRRGRGASTSPSPSSSASA